jgi:Stage II sporulation protein E (SpoIIE)
MKTKHLLLWFLLAAGSLALFAWSFPRAYPTSPRLWTISLDEAKSIAVERFRDLGEEVPAALVDVTLAKDDLLDRRLALAGAPQEEPLGASRITQAAYGWEVRVYGVGAKPREWTYLASVSPRGELTGLRLRLPDTDAGREIEPARAVAEASAFLERQGFDLGQFEEPEMRTTQLDARTDRTVRYRDRGGLLGPNVPYGVEVAFAGDRLAGYRTWLDDPDAAGATSEVQPLLFANLAWRALPLLLLPIVAFFFLRRYHAGEIGARRGVEIFVALFGTGIVFVVLCRAAIGSGWDFGILSRQQVNWISAFQIAMFYFFPLAVVGFLAWGVGELFARERYPWRLAGFDALWQGKWANATVARDTLRGTAFGFGLLTAQTVLIVVVAPLGIRAPLAFNTAPWFESVRWLGPAAILLLLGLVVYSELLGRLLLAGALEARLGRIPGALLAALIATFLLAPPTILLPVKWTFIVSFLVALAQVAIFLRYGLATAIFANLASSMLSAAYPFLLSQDPWQQGQAALALLVPALPALVSLRHVTSGRELEYRWEDVPPHVRRIAERERQRVELETARNIQSSILPELPPSLNGVELAHSYQPATEVGGDFYDVLALEDGRLAVALGDVAGHGVSSGLVMSMARSALAVQVTFNPEVEAVLSTLNRVVFQSARKRLLATLCYAVLDPVRRELLYASAGHLYPYVVSKDGRVRPLEYDAYPLGVRERITVQARMARLDAGDTLFLLSDGIVEAHAEGSEEMFGFERLEQSLKRHAHLPVAKLRDAVLAEVAAHSKDAPREDDQTVLVLRVA